MSLIGSEALVVLTFLLPGFVSAAVFHSLTPHLRPTGVERLIQALMFTAVVQGLLSGALVIGGTFALVAFSTIGDWSPATGRLLPDIFLSLPLAVVVSVLAAYLANHDTLHKLFRRIGLTRETSYPSDWYLVFSEIHPQYVILHLTGQRRLYGFPEHWPNRSDEGHFQISEAEWLADDPNEENIPANVMLIPAAEVEMVQFVGIRPSETQGG